LRNRQKKTAFQQNLERLKRSSSIIYLLPYPPHSIGTGKKQGSLPLEAHQPEDEDDSPEPFEGAKPDGDSDSDAHSSDENANEALEEDSFIVEDDNAVVPQLPAMFSMNTHQDLAHHFKVICQLFVHLAVSPARKRHNLMQSVLKGRNLPLIDSHI
jgi:hypothetical protein